MSAALNREAPCGRCRGVRHVWTGDGFERCPDCFLQSAMQRELANRSYPAQWASLSPEVVIGLFGPTSVVGQTLTRIVSGQALRVHAYGASGYPRQAFIGSLVMHFLKRGEGCQVLDTRDLAFLHFTDEKGGVGRTLFRTREPVILQLGHEVETKLGYFYFRSLLDRALQYDLPFVLVTDAPLEVMGGRYEDLLPTMRSVGFDVTNVALMPEAQA